MQFLSTLREKKSDEDICTTEDDGRKILLKITILSRKNSSLFLSRLWVEETGASSRDAGFYISKSQADPNP